VISAETVARNIDVLPTLLDLLGLPIARDIEGISAKPAILGTGGYDPEAAVIEWNDQILCWRTHEWMYAHKTRPELYGANPNDPPFDLIDAPQPGTPDPSNFEIDVEELYDLKADPHEQRNLLVDPPIGIDDPETASPDALLAATKSLLDLHRRRESMRQALDLWQKGRLNAITDAEAEGAMAQTGYLNGGGESSHGQARQSRVLELAAKFASDAIERSPAPTAEAFAMAAESIWLRGDKKAARLLLQRGLTAHPQDDSLVSLNNRFEKR